VSVRLVPSRSRRRWPLITLGVILVLIFLLSILSGFFVDLLWFREVHFSSVFWTILTTKIALGIAFGVFFFVLLYVNLLIVRRMTPSFGLASPDQEVIDRYRAAFEPYIRWLIPLFAALVALLVGIGVGSQWRTFLLWRNSSGVSFHTVEPVFHRDPAFYVFDLPWLEFVQGWLFSSLVGVTFLAGVGHYLWGGIRPQSVGEKVTPQVKAHLSVLLGLIVLTKAWGYQLGKFDLLTSARGVVQGASYTDIHAQLPALKLLVFIAIACSILFLVNIRFRGWALPVLGVGLLALASVVVGGIFPTAIQKFQVDPQEFQKEQPYIVNNIHSTREAFGLDAVQSTQSTIAPDLTTSDVTKNQTTVDNIRLWDPDLLKADFEQLQRIKQFYEFSDVDVDRYPIQGQERMTMISAREVSQNGIPGGGGTWQNRHLVYTHGYGVVASQVNGSTSDGSPLFVESNIPPQGVLTDTQHYQPRVYYGERSDVPFVVVRTGAQEVDFQAASGQEQKAPLYSGSGGIQLGGFFQRALFAWRFKDVNLLISSLVHPDSRILIYRDIKQRVPKAAPFLQFDHDPYSAVVDGHIDWIWDAYTTTSGFPYSQEVNLADAAGQPDGIQGLQGIANYVRNSVKVVVDAYTGQMTYYVSDPSDPIIQVWMRAFPDLFTPMSSASPDLQAHFRYPENLFQVQAAQYANYHVTDPSTFYGKADFWSIPVDPAAAANEKTTSGTSTIPTVSTSSGPPMRPYYVLTQLPGGTGEGFSLFIPFTPQGRPNMVAWMAAGSDPSAYGKLTAFAFPGGENIDGPVQVFNQMQSFPQFSQEQTLLGSGGSRVLFGNFLVIPLENSFLYVQPVFVRSNQQDAFPVLKRVLVFHGGTVGLGTTLQEAIANSFGGQISPSGGGHGGGGQQQGGTVDQQIQGLLNSALQHFSKANAALTQGDLATYAKEIQRAQDLVRQANDLAATQKGGSGGGGTAPTSTPTPTVVPTLPATPTVSATPSP
jgi:uncharacterized membrane protein (UPF0182 family)